MTDSPNIEERRLSLDEKRFEREEREGRFWIKFLPTGTGALITVIGVLLSAWVGGWFNRSATLITTNSLTLTERDREINELNIAETGFEANLIQHLLTSADNQQAIKSLESFANAGLFPHYADRIHKLATENLSPPTPLVPLNSRGSSVSSLPQPPPPTGPNDPNFYPNVDPIMRQTMWNKKLRNDTETKLWNDLQVKITEEQAQRARIYDHTGPIQISKP